MRVRLLSPAQQELIEAFNYYNNERAGLGDEFRHEAWLAVQRIREFPSAWFPIGNGIRRCQLRRFPYGLIYEALQTETIIIAVAHLHRRPDYWRARIQRISVSGL